MGKGVRIEELAEITGISAVHLRRHQKAGMPVDTVPTRGVPTLYDTADVIQWLIDRAVSERVRQAGGGEKQLFDLDQERARLSAAQADKTELEVAKLRGELVHIDEVAAGWAIIASTVKSGFLTLASRLGDRLFGAESRNELVDDLHNGILDALEELQDRGSPQLTYDEPSEASKPVTH